MTFKAGDRVVNKNKIEGTIQEVRLVYEYTVRWDQGYATVVKDKDIKEVSDSRSNS